MIIQNCAELFRTAHYAKLRTKKILLVSVTPNTVATLHQQ